MKQLRVTTFKFAFLSFIIILIFLGSYISYSQPVQVTRWSIKNAEIQGISPGPFRGNTYNTWYTDYGKKKIGRLTNSPGLNANLKVWTPAFDTPYEFKPFKIAFGWWNFSIKTMPALLNYPPFSGIITEGTPYSSKDLKKLADIMRLFLPRPIFTLPNAQSGDGRIGMLMPNISGGNDYFWVWDPPIESKLNNPWDIQRRNPFPKEKYAWISDMNGINGIFQFSPVEGALYQWDIFTSTRFIPEVFYVVPALPSQKFTEIWLGGKDSADLSTCIAHLKVFDPPDHGANLTIWDFNISSVGKLVAIVFTQKPDLKNSFFRSQVWLASNTQPELYILKPNSLYFRDGKDSVCILEGNKYSSPLGLYYPFHLLSTANDNNRRIFIPAGGLENFPYFLSANRGEVSQQLISKKYLLTPKRFIVPFDTVLALSTEDILEPKIKELITLRDTIGCNINRAFWNNPAFDGDFSNAILDIDLWGRATFSEAGFVYDIVWHEPKVDGKNGTIGRIVTGSLSISKSEQQWLNEDELTNFDLMQNYPNPFNPLTTIEYVLPKMSQVTIKVYNSLGQEVETLLNNEIQDAGEHSVVFNSNNYSSGVYYYRIRALEMNEGDDGEISEGREYINVKKMLLVK